MEVTTAARKLLLNDDTVNGYVTGKVFKDVLTEAVSGTGGRAIVVRVVGGWSPGDHVQTIEYPLLQIECVADPDRDIDGTITTANAVDKAMAVARACDRALHGLRDSWWPDTTGLRVVSCVRWSEPIVNPHDDALGDAVMVWSRYALQVVHSG